MKRLRRVVVAGVLLTAVGLLGSCEQLIGCDGVIRDDTGKPIAGVHVTLQQNEMSEEAVLSDDSGRFQATQLIGYVGAPPHQVVTFDKVGYQRQRVDLTALYKRQEYSLKLRDSMVVIMKRRSTPLTSTHHRF